MKNKTDFYVVKKGRNPGIYKSWAECEAQIKGYPGAIYKKFVTYEEAYTFYTNKKLILSEREAYAFVDGSYNQLTQVYGYGGFLCIGNEKIILQGNGNDIEMIKMRNVAGEILGAIAAVSKALELNLPSITLYYDYEGIEAWATDRWRANKIGTIGYRNFMKKAEKEMKIYFMKVKSHAGIEGNEEADLLAKQAVGLLKNGKSENKLNSIPSVKIKPQQFLRDIPMQPIELGMVADIRIGKCGKCKQPITEFQKYCDQCGQKIGWEESLKSNV